jgi:membrane-associated phospholipid phosphatase
MRKNLSYKLAESLSLALNPFLLLPVIFLIALFSTSFPTTTTQSKWLGIILFANLLIPLWIVFYLDQQGIVLDDTLKNAKLHRQRLIALLPIVAIIFLEVIVMLLTKQHEPLFAVFVSSLVIAFIGGLISYYWKISAHSLGLSTTIAFLFILAGPWALLGALAIPFLAWSRLVLHRHTPLQLVVGFVVPPLIIGVVFYLLHLI